MQSRSHPTSVDRRWRWAVAVAVAIAAVVQWPALDGTLFDDDYPQLGFLAGLEHPALHARGWLDLYRFDEVAFFRPLSSALMALDAALFRTNIWAFHHHSLAWYLAIVVTVAALFRRLTPSISVTAALLFALGRAAGSTVVWWCNRHLLVSALFGCLGFLAHVRWRERQWRHGRWLAPLALVASLLAGESGLQGFAFIAAYELVGAPGNVPRARRLRAVAAVVGVAVFYVVVRGVLGYGVHGSSWGYVDPLREPSQFALTALRRLPELVRILLGGGLDRLPALGRGASDGLAAVMVLAWLALIVRPAWSGLPDPETRGLRSLLLGGILSLPISLASPQPLVRLMPSVATAAVVATLVFVALRWLTRPAAVVWRCVAAVVTVVLFGAHAIGSALAAFSDATRQSEQQRAAHRAIVDAPLAPSDRAVLVTSGWWYLGQGRTALALFRPGSNIDAWAQLELGLAPVTAARTAWETLTLAPSDGGAFHDVPWAALGRGEAIPVGPDLRATVLENEGARVSRIELAFVGRPIGSFGLFAFRGSSLVRLDVPDVGSTARW
jgi:hypothetical protein